MFESEGLAFLKEQSVPDPHLKGLISLCDSVDSVFTLLDTQFSDKATDYRVLIRYIFGYLHSKKTMTLSINQQS